MIFGLKGIDVLVISLLFITAFNTLLTYILCSSALNHLKRKESIAVALNKLRIYDEYILSKVNILIAIIYFFIGYYVTSYYTTSIYIILFSVLISFLFTLITMVTSRLFYSYTVNVLLETTLDEWDCIKENFKTLIITYIPFGIFTFAIPSLIVMEAEFTSKVISISIFVLVFIVLWLLSTPKILIITLGAKKIDNPLLKHRLDILFKKHKIKKYELYSWDSSKTKDSNALVSGFLIYYVFISTTLLEDITLPELEAIMTHEIGHIKNKHLLKLMFNKVIMLMLFVGLLVLPFVLDLNTTYMLIIYVISVILFIFSFFYNASKDRSFENEADAYSKEYNNSEVFASALRKISRYEQIESETSSIDRIFQSHPDIKERLKNIKD